VHTVQLHRIVATLKPPMGFGLKEVPPRAEMEAKLLPYGLESAGVDPDTDDDLFVFDDVTFALAKQVMRVMLQNDNWDPVGMLQTIAGGDGGGGAMSEASAGAVLAKMERERKARLNASRKLIKRTVRHHSVLPEAKGLLGGGGLLGHLGARGKRGKTPAAQKEPLLGGGGRGGGVGAADEDEDEDEDDDPRAQMGMAAGGGGDSGDSGGRSQGVVATPVAARMAPSGRAATTAAAPCFAPAGGAGGARAVQVQSRAQARAQARAVGAAQAAPAPPGKGKGLGPGPGPGAGAGAGAPGPGPPQRFSDRDLEMASSSLAGERRKVNV
jgi:hypothetical protein